MGARKGCSRLETYGKYGSARQWCWCQRQLQGVARSLAQWAGQLSLEYEWKDRVVREERQRWVALGMSQVREAEAMGQRGLLTAAKGGLGLVHAFARGKHSILQHATTHVKMMAEAQQQAAHAIQVRATRHVLHTEARGTQQHRLPCTALFVEYIDWGCRLPWGPLGPLAPGLRSTTTGWDAVSRFSVSEAPPSARVVLYTGHSPSYRGTFEADDPISLFVCGVLADIRGPSTQYPGPNPPLPSPIPSLVPSPQRRMRWWSWHDWWGRGGSPTRCW